MKAIRITFLLVALLGLGLGTLSARGGLPPGEEISSTEPRPTNTPSKIHFVTAKAATTLLEKAPILEPLPEGALKEDEFITLAQAVLANSDLRTTVEAVEALEDARKVLGGGKVTATISSTPDGWTVKYKDWLDHKFSRGEWLSVATPASPKVDSMQIFICTKSDGESCGQRVRPCDTNANCIATFP